MCAIDVACRGGVLSDLVVGNGFSVGDIGLGAGIGRAWRVGYLGIGLVLGLLRGGLSLGAGLSRAAFGGGALVLVGEFLWCRVFMGPLGVAVGGLPIWPGEVSSRQPFVCQVNDFVVDIRFFF